jgi:cytochrome b561
MPLRNNAKHWGAVQQAFHWLIVLLILAQGTIGLVMVNLPKKPSVFAIYNLHKSIGLTILASPRARCTCCCSRFHCRAGCSTRPARCARCTGGAWYACPVSPAGRRRTCATSPPDFTKPFSGA